MVSFTTFKGSKDGIVESKTTKEVAGDKVLVRVTHSGLCGTDIHYKSADMVLGHEGVGVVEEVGDKVTLFKKGDRVGWGYEHSSCGHCRQCLSGTETYCPERAMYGAADLDQGSLAIQFASKMGCEVVVFSGTSSKKSEAESLGATEFHAMKDRTSPLDFSPDQKIDHLLVTTSAQPDWSLYLPIMAPGGTIYPLTVSEGDLKIPYMPIVSGGLRIQGSVVAPRQIHREMLRFAAVHGIKPIVQEFPLTLEGVNEAFEKLEKGDMRYRGVLVAQ